VLLIGLVGLLLLIQLASFIPAVGYVWKLAAWSDALLG